MVFFLLLLRERAASGRAIARKPCLSLFSYVCSAPANYPREGFAYGSLPLLLQPLSPSDFASSPRHRSQTSRTQSFSYDSLYALRAIIHAYFASVFYSCCANARPPAAQSLASFDSHCFPTFLASCMHTHPRDGLASGLCLCLILLKTLTLPEFASSAELLFFFPLAAPSRAKPDKSFFPATALRCTRCW